jgi:hypothetical protein
MIEYEGLALTTCLLPGFTAMGEPWPPLQPVSRRNRTMFSVFILLEQVTLLLYTVRMKEQWDRMMYQQ